MCKEIWDMLVKPMTSNQEKLAVHYSILFLNSSIIDINKDIEKITDPTIKELMTSRLKELEKDLKTFEKINENFG